MPVGKSVSNIFNLVHHFGNEEDQISANFGFILYINRSTALIDFLKRLAIPVNQLKRKDVQRIDIETQVPYQSNKTRSIIDLQIRLDNRFLVFIEAKIGGSGLGKGQIRKYAKLLGKEKPFYDNVRLVFITQFNRREEFESEVRKASVLGKNETYYFRWEEIREFVDRHNTKANIREINNLFLEYVGDKMADKRIIAEQKIKDVKEVMINATDDDWWELTLEENIATQNNDSPDVQFVAFYRTSQRAITHIARVKYTEKNIPPRETYKKYPKIIQKGIERKWIDTPHKVYYLGELIELPVPIRKESGSRGTVRNKWFKTLTQIFQARTLSDLNK